MPPRRRRNIPGMDEAQGRTPSPDDTAAFQRFYAATPADQPKSRGRLYRALIGWWRDRR
jgi:hypothetical protein